MDDLISRQAAIDALDKLCDRICEYSKKQRHTMCGACNLGSAFDVIDELPTAEPEIIRCKDCVAYGESLPQVDKRMICHKWAINFPEDFYCAVAERRSDG